jgi:type I restriction enzyme S subunit
MNLETFFEKFELFADAPEAVKKMRELVLQLAVRGQLVSQNPEDEPASKAIERLLELNRSGRITKLQAEEKTVGLPFDVPASWKWVRFGDLVRIRTGKLDANAAVEGGEYPFFTCSKTPSQIDDYSFDTSAVILAGNGDFNLKSYSGKFDAYQRTYVIEPLGWELRFCFWLISGQIKRITNNQRGSAIPYLRLGDIADPFVPFPPLAEQKRIVAKVDELMALCDRLEAQQQEREERHAALARASLARFAEAPTPANLHFLFHPSFAIPPADLRKSILTLAVQGKLVPQDPNDEPAKELVERVAALREQFSPGKRAKAAKRIKELDDSKCIHDIPDLWTWCRLGDLVFDFRYGTSRRCARNVSGVPVLRIPNIQSGRIDSTDLKFTDMPPAEFNELRLRDGDLLVVRSNGSESLVGRSAVASVNDERFAYAGYLVRARLAQMEIFAPFLHVALSTPSVRDQIEGPIRTTSGVKNINTTELSNLVFPLPPLAEQRRIVGKVEQLMALVDALETQLAASRAAAEKLLSALLAELTRGKAAPAIGGI